VQPVRRSDNGAGVLLVGHEFEAVTPVSWTFDMRARIGGTPLILDDDIHASLDFTACARHAVDFLVSGKRPPRRCAGVPVPGPEEERSIASAARKPWPIPGRPADRRNS